ncbi:MAG: carbohydrate kinase family protein [Planctomycetota bacterium]
MNTPSSLPSVVVAGHICLDIIPQIRPFDGGLDALLVPGKLIDVGAATISTGGAVSNTGIALHKLGIPVKLMSKLGDDPFGRMILDLMRGIHSSLADSMIISQGDSSSYSVVINPPGIDRIFLHCPGANNTFRSDDVPADVLRSAALVHFGYPTLMRNMFINDGEDLERLLRAAKQSGATTSLDMARIDPEGPAGKADWTRILERALPFVDVFLPSIDEILFIMDKDAFRAMETGAFPSDAIIQRTAQRLIDMGVAMAVMKLGDKGLVLKTSKESARWERAGSRLGDWSQWRGVDLRRPCFKVNVSGTTGAGDTTIAGFIAGLVRGLPPEKVMESAVAAGAFCVEKPDAVSGIPDWDTLTARIRNGWETR